MHRTANLLRLICKPREGRLRSYASAILFVAAATALRLALGHTLSIRAPFVTFYPAVLLAALVGGLGAAVISTVLSTLVAAYLFFDPERMAV